MKQLIKSNSFRYITKKELYDIINQLSSQNGFHFESVNYKVNAINLAHKVCRNLKLEYLDFKTLNICGLLYKTDKTTSIALNSRRSQGGRNFDCMHELIHYWLHDNNEFYCYDKTINSPDSDYFEWQANEGAAQFLMPYQIFIPEYCRLLKSLPPHYTQDHVSDEIEKRLAARFNVGKQSITVRLKSLENEIKQYKNGVPLNKIEIISYFKQNSLN